MKDPLLDLVKTHYHKNIFVQSAEAAQYTDCSSVEKGKTTLLTNVLVMTLNNLMVKSQ